MKPFFAALLFFVITGITTTNAQKSVDKVKFFTDTAVVNATLKFNFKKIMSDKDKIGALFPATLSCKMNDGLDVNDHITLEVRGHFRRSYCYLPPLKVIFKNDSTAAFYQLKSLKLVSPCMATRPDDQNLLKEYVIYKIYNLITDKSFRVRLLNLNYQDSSGKKKTITQHAFLIEDVKQTAKRNECVDWTDHRTPTEKTNRKQMTIVNIFEYMIGNTDWSVTGSHNIKLVHSKSDSVSRPFVVPYDFDFSGLVGTNYSAPDERLGIANVKERLYRGFPRTIEEVNEALEIFKKQKENIYATINNFSLLTNNSKKEMTLYLDDFFETISSKNQVKNVFVDGARTQ